MISKIGVSVDAKDKAVHVRWFNMDLAYTINSLETLNNFAERVRKMSSEMRHGGQVKKTASWSRRKVNYSWKLMGPAPCDGWKIRSCATESCACHLSCCLSWTHFLAIIWKLRLMEHKNVLFFRANSLNAETLAYKIFAPQSNPTCRVVCLFVELILVTVCWTMAADWVII